MGHESSGYTPIAGMHGRGEQPKERPPAIQATYGGGPSKDYRDRKIEELEKELARYKGFDYLPYGEELLRFVSTHPRMDYDRYGNGNDTEKKLSGIYNDGLTSGRDEILSYVRTFIEIHGPGEKIKPKPPKNIVKTEGATLRGGNI